MVSWAAVSNLSADCNIVSDCKKIKFVEKTTGQDLSQKEGTFNLFIWYFCRNSPFIIIHAGIYLQG
jgi:hypothetical protein